ncbi:MAG TPA: ABC transporter substrate-binding protein [Chloroflexota bacterium]|nr:ABC transporter substrate-binding protein [Chloroflexota bacterium]
MGRVSRRDLLRGTLTAGLSAAVLPLVGCGGQAGPISSVPADTLRVAYSGLLPALDPHAWSSALGPRTLAPLFDSLTFIQSDGQLRPALALAWSQPSPTVWRFRLRVNDAKFQNGEMFGPESVRLTFDRLKNGTFPLSRLAKRVERVDVVDPATVSLTTTEADPELPRWISAIYMLPPTYFNQVGEQGFATQPIGTGFWQLDEFQPGSHLYLTQFRDTWRGDRGATAPPPLKRLQLQVQPDAAARAQSLSALQIDIATELQESDVALLQGGGFAIQTTDVGQLNAPDVSWQTSAFGGGLASGKDVLATVANLKGATPLPNDSWWFDRVTKTAGQRIAVAGGA